MKKLGLALFFAGSLPVMALDNESVLNEEQTQQKRLAVYTKMDENLLYLNHLVAMAAEPNKYQDWFHQMIKDFTADVTISYLNMLGYKWDNLPYVGHVARMLGQANYTSLSSLGKVDLNFFDEKVVNEERTKGFVYGKANSFSVKRDTTNPDLYLMQIKLNSGRDHSGELATYLGKLDTNSMQSYIDFVGPEGRRLTLNLNRALKPQEINTARIKKVFEDMLNLRSKNKEAVFEARWMDDSKVIQTVYVDPHIPNGMYSFSYLPQKTSLLREAYTGLPLKNKNTGKVYCIRGTSYVEVHSINETWRAVVPHDDEGKPKDVHVGPGFKIHFSPSVDRKSTVLNSWFSVNQKVPDDSIDLLANVDWYLVERGSGLDFGAKFLQTLVKIARLPSNKDAYEMSRETLPILIARLAIMKDMAVR